MYRVLAELFPYIVFFYLAEAVIYVRRDEWAFISSWLGRFRLEKHGLRIAGIAPTAEVISSYRPALYLTSKGVYSPKGRDAEHRPVTIDDFCFTPFEAISEVHLEDKVVRSGGRVLFKAPSATVARRTATLLEELCRLDPRGRASRLRYVVQEAMDFGTLRSYREQHVESMTLLKIGSSALAGSVFILLPIELFSGSFRFPGLLPVIATLYVAVIIMSASTLRACGLGCRAVASAMAPLLLLPPAGMRAVSLIAREIYSHFDPLALAAELLPAASFLDVARKAYHDIMTAKERTAGTDLVDFWKLREGAWHQLLGKRGLTAKEVLAPPRKSDEASVAYCPRCRAEYQVDREMCADCAVALKAFRDDADSVVSATAV